MKRNLLSIAAIPLIIGGLSTTLSAEGTNILNDMKYSGQILTRYESADKEGGADAASAFTTRTRLAVEAGLLGVDGLSTKVGVTTVNNFGYTDYNSKNPVNTKYDLILDPQKAMLSEAFLSYKSGKTAVAAGRSHINLDDQRFIGTVGWRQLERAYDTLNVVNTSVENLTFLGAYVYGYEGVSAAPTTDTSSVLLNANYKATDSLTVSAFGYLLADVHDTYGVRLTGKTAMSGTKFSYAASYAMQTTASLDYSDASNADIDASYLDIALNANINGLILGAEYESLGQANGSSTKGFTTPLATLHKFQGFADEFLGQSAASNNAGLIDTSIKAGYAAKGFGKALVFYHNFSSENGSLDLGSEIDALYVNKIPGVNGLKGLLKVAMYSAGEATSGHTNDNTKFWAQLDYKF